MVKPLGYPVRPLPAAGSAYGWRWRAPTAARPWGWCRVYHRGAVSPKADTPRSNGPRARFDPHRAGPSGPREDPDGRSVLYAGLDLATSACEVFGETGEALLCPSYRVALLRPTKQLTLFDLRTPGSALSIGAIPALADGEYPRAQTQAWALAIYEDDPLGAQSDGVRYRSAYNGGDAIAVWDSAGKVTVVRDGAGIPRNYPLNHPEVRTRLLVAMAPRHITVRTVPASECSRCP